MNTFLKGTDSKSILSAETENYLKNKIGAENFTQHFDQLPVKDAKTACKGDRYWGDWRFVYSTSERDAEYTFLLEQQRIKLSNLAMEDVIDEENFCIDHRNFGLAAKACK